MTDCFETTIKNYSGLSTETKPTIAAGNAVPNGSRWREVDTEKTYFFNLSDDTWYEYGHDVDEGEKTKQLVQDDNAEHLLSNILKELKIMNLHLSILTDNEIKKTEVE